MNDKQRAYKLLSILLQYPEQVGDIKPIQKEVYLLLNIQVKELLQSFLNHYSSQDNGQISSDYINLFDFNANTTLYLTYPEFSESLERGAALLNIKRELHSAGYNIKINELPDYLPLLLEFASLDLDNVADRLLTQYSNAIIKLNNELKAVDSPYHFLIEAIIVLIEESHQEDLKGGVL